MVMKKILRTGYSFIGGALFVFGIATYSKNEIVSIVAILIGIGLFLYAFKAR